MLSDMAGSARKIATDPPKKRSSKRAAGVSAPRASKDGVVMQFARSAEVRKVRTDLERALEETRREFSEQLEQLKSDNAIIRAAAEMPRQPGPSPAQIAARRALVEAGLEHNPAPSREEIEAIKASWRT
jgi:hypothetical protein